MAGDRPVTFDESTARRLIGMLRERRSDTVPHRQDVPSVAAATRRHRWAKATTNYLHPVYPTSGNVVLVEFGEYVYSHPTGVNQTVSPVWTPYTTNAYDDGGFALAVLSPGSIMPAVSDVVRVELDDGVWWVRPASLMRKARASSTITDGGSGTAEIWQSGAASGTTVTVYYDWMTGGGDIASGTDLLIYYFADEQHWSVIAAECA